MAHIDNLKIILILSNRFYCQEADRQKNNAIFPEENCLCMIPGAAPNAFTSSPSNTYQTISESILGAPFVYRDGRNVKGHVARRENGSSRLSVSAF